jgi:hypothetical protein
MQMEFLQIQEKVMDKNITIMATIKSIQFEGLYNDNLQVLESTIVPPLENIPWCTLFLVSLYSIFVAILHGNWHFLLWMILLGEIIRIIGCLDMRLVTFLTVPEIPVSMLSKNTATIASGKRGK